MGNSEYSILHDGGPGAPWDNARIKKNAAPNTALANYNRIQSELWDYYAMDQFPDIIGMDRHAVLTEWFHRAPFGQPRYVDVNTLRLLGKSHWVEMCMKVRINEIATLDWDVVALDADRANDTAIEDAYEFLSHPNQNQESFSHVLKGFLRDLFWFDAGVIVKTFSGISQERKFSVPERYQEHWGPEISRNLPFPHQYSYYRHKGRLLKQLPVKGAKLEEFYARDGSSFAKDVDEFGITRGYWQYTFKYPSVAPIPFSDREIIYAVLNPVTSGPYGMSPIEHLSEVLNTLVASTLWNYKFFEEGGIPDGILAIMNMSIDEFKVWRAYFTEEIQGQPHKLPMINPGTGGDVKWIPFSPSQSDLEFLKSQDWYLHLVAALFEVNFNELGFTDTVNRATSEEQSQVFKRRAIRPLLDTIEWYINLELMQELWNMGMPDTVFKFLPVIDSFEQARMTTNYVSEIQVGLRTVNEIRTKDMGLDDVDWGHEPQWFQEHNKPQPAPYNPFGNGEDPNGEEESEEVQEEDREEEQERLITNTVRVLLKELNLQKPLAMQATSTHAGTDTISINVPPLDEPELEPIGEDSFYNLPNPSNIAEEDPRASNTKTLEEEFEREIREIFETQEKEILEALGVLQKGFGVERIRAALDRIDGKFYKNFIDVVRRFIVRALTRGGNKAHKELELAGSFELRHDAAERYMQDFSALLANSKFKQVRERVRSILVEGLEKGESAEKITETLTKEFSHMKKYEARRIAVTETNRAFNRTREAVYLKSGMVKAKQWIVTWDDRLSEDCRAMANQVVPLGQSFITYSGTMVEAPPLHPNCRCTVLPVLKPEARRTIKGFYKPTNKMRVIEEYYEKEIHMLLQDLLGVHGSLKKVAEKMNKEGLKVTTMSLSNWCRQFGIETVPKGGDQSQFFHKNSEA